MISSIPRPGRGDKMENIYIPVFLCSTLKVILCDNIGNGIIGIIKVFFFKQLIKKLKS